MAWPKGKSRKVAESWKVSSTDWNDLTRVWDDVDIGAALEGIPHAAQRRWPLAAVVFLLWRWALEGGRKSFEGALESCWPLLGEVFANSGKPLAAEPVTATALGQARELLGAEPLKRMLRVGTEKALKRFDSLARWRGRRLWALDGSTIRLFPSAALRESFGGPSTDQGHTVYPCMRVAALDLVNLGWIAAALPARYGRSEISLGRELTSCLRSGDVFLADRQFFDTGWWWNLVNRGVDFLIRVKSNRLLSLIDDDQKRIEATRRAGNGATDWDVQLRISAAARKEYSEAPGALAVRYIEIPRPGAEPLLFMTTLSREQLPVEEAQALYRRRWEEETEWRYLKGANHIHLIQSRKKVTAEQEFWLHILAHNSVRWAHGEACLRARSRSLSPRKLFRACG